MKFSLDIGRPWREIARRNPGFPQPRFPVLTGCVNASGAMHVFPTSSVRECAVCAGHVKNARQVELNELEQRRREVTHVGG